MVQKPALESVVVTVISVMAVGLTVAALVMPVKAPAAGVGAPPAARGVTASPVSRSLARGLAADGENGSLSRQAAAAAGKAMAPSADALGPRLCALSLSRAHVGRQASHHRMKPSCDGISANAYAGTGPAGGDESGLGAPPTTAGGGAEPCSEQVRPEAVRPERCCLLDR
jgi:hypothetical protein